MSHRTTTRSERGFTLAALIIFLTALSIALAAAAPAYKMQAQRELEQELIFRGQEYVRAIQKYQRSFGIFPPNIDALLDTNGVRYLRRPYIDPITGDGFRLLTVNPDGTINGSTMYQQLAGQQDLFRGGTPQMFGDSPSSQPFGAQQAGAFGGAVGAGTPSGQQGRGNPQGRGQAGTGSGQGGFGLGGFGQQSGGGGTGGGFGPGGFGGQQSGFGQAIAPNNQAGRGNFGQPGFGQGGGQGLGQQGQGSQAGFASGGGFGGSQIGTTPTTTTGSGGGGFGNTNLSAGGIVGVAPLNENTTLIVYNQRELYNEWEFIALPGFGTVPMTSPLAGLAAQPGTGAQNPFGQSQVSPFGQGQPSPFGQNPATGTAPSPPGLR